MGFLSRLLGNDDVISKGAEVIDKSFYTDQEKAERFTSLLETYEVFKIAQRWLMLVVCPAYVFMTFVTWMIEVVAALKVKKIDLTQAHQILHGDMSMAFILICVFYFGGGALEGVVNRFRKVRK